MVYLTIGILPATAQRDLEIMGLLGQLALCDRGDQNVRDIIVNNLAFFNEKFAGWSGLVRTTANKYGLPDPLQYMEHPWRPDRWRSHCKTVIADYWDKKLRAEAKQKTSSLYADLESLSTSAPMRIWQQAGLSAIAAKEATIVSWLFCNTFFTRELLHKMRKIDSPNCICENSVPETVIHFLLHCSLYDHIRQQYIPNYIQMNNKVLEIANDETLLVISILDPLSSKLPEQIIKNWSSVSQVYEVSRKFCYRMFLMREKIYKEN